jgi:lipopolysaccharide biosynthesis regulator YciM
MVAESGFLLVLLLVVAAATGWFFARLTGSGTGKENSGADFSSDYLEGLNFLLNEQPDEALGVFVRMVDVDSETIDTHFALGSLFRKRGEVHRAISIHQNIIDRSDLPQSDRDRAMMALAEDYLKAGILDRAEAILGRLSERTNYRQAALEGLVGIYEQERDWEKAIETRDQLAIATPSGGSASIVAHYFCELAEEAVTQGNEAQQREYLRRARAADHNCIRGALLRADKAVQEDDHRLAARLYIKVMQTDSAFVPMVLKPLRACYVSMDDEKELEKLLSRLVSELPELRPGIAYAAILDGGFNDMVTMSCIEDFIAQNPILLDLMEILTPAATHEDARKNIQRVSYALKKLAGRGPSYLCENCGFTGSVLEWRCPTCKQWDTTRPMNFFRLQVMLKSPPKNAVV